VSKRLTVERLAYPWHLRLADRVLGGLGAMGLQYVSLDRERILDNARRNVGLDDFGGSAFLEPMDMVLEAATARGLTNIGKVATRASYVKALTNRLRMREHLAKFPHIRDTPIRKPIFIVGFPRSGTTLLQNLMAQADNRRGLRFWELLTPVPVNAQDPAADRHRRERAARIALAASAWVAPEMNAVHEVRIDSFEECWYLFIPAFAVLNWDLQLGLDGYSKWLLEHDMRGPYEEYRTWLKLLLQNEHADHLLLKCPEHLWFLDALLDVFPDACVVWTHRDPVVSIASYCSLMTLPRRMLLGEIDPVKLGREITDRFHVGVQRAMEARKRHDPARFYDVDFLDLVKDPISVVHDISRHFELDEPANFDERIQAWQNSRRSDKRGAHVYSGERYGIDPAAIHAQYADYIEAFDIPINREAVNA
jgi:hypothetical protein